MVAVNQRYARDDQTVTAADEVAIIPPVAGG
jgi:molybdopterin converting factor small subunit